MAQTDFDKPLQTAEVSLFLADEARAADMAQIFAKHLRAGDTVLLSGPVGAGKTHFARTVIRAFFGQDTEVPSPSFTLVQTYGGDEFDIWHVDLYRLCDISDVIELGLDDAMETQLCLIEWPDRLPAVPEHAISLNLVYDGEGRRATITGMRADLHRALTLAFAP